MVHIPTAAASAKISKLKHTPTVSEHLEKISKEISKASLEGEFEAILREEPYCYWLYGTKPREEISQQVIQELRSLGYDVSLHYKESQFVDIGLKISWEGVE